MSRTTVLTAILCVGLLLVGASLHADQIEGTVIDRDGVGRSGCQVDFEGPATYRVVTNSNGAYFLENPRHGTYQVTVTQGDRTKQFDEVRVGPHGLSPSTLVVVW